MRGRSSSKSSSSSSSGDGNNDGLIATGLGYLAGSSGSGGISTGDGVKYGVECSADDQSDYCKNVKRYNQFQMAFSVFMTIVGVILALVFLYFLYKMYNK